MEEQKCKTKGKAWYSHIWFLIAVVVIIFFKYFVMDKVIISGVSMQETLYNGEAVWIDKLFWKQSELQRFDIVVVKTEAGEIIKRIIGLPNEEIQIVDGVVYVNGKKLENDIDTLILESGMAADKIHVADGEYFVMGDNRNASGDSRNAEIGNVKLSDIVGKPFYRYYPFNKVGEVK